MTKEKATIFNIQKFAIHDGPGIRTAVFIKGCPLSCDWCANPESQDSARQLMYLEQNCQAHHECVKVCEPAALKAIEGGVSIDFNTCTVCGDCVDVCPENALKIYGEEMTVDEVLSEVEKDLPFYAESGGGMTLSGGEPLLHISFALDLLRKAKLKGIHTAVETCGMVATSSIEKVLPYTDLFLYDYKLSDETRLKEMTGAEKSLIMKNLGVLDKYNGNIILRCIIIPGINDTEKHLKNIADLSNQFTNIEAIHIMPYHQYGVGKYKQVGRVAKKVAPKSVTMEEALHWKLQLQGLGSKKVEIG